jgi:Tfp pilus assembly protein PilE
MIVIAIIGILAAVAIPMYSDYTKKSRTSEVASNLKEVVQSQILWKEDPNGGGRVEAEFASAILTTGYKTSKGLFSADAAGCKRTIISEVASGTPYACGTYYGFKTNAVNACLAAVSTTESLAVAEAIDDTQVPTEWQKACMEKTFSVNHAKK